MKKKSSLCNIVQSDFRKKLNTTKKQQEKQKNKKRKMYSKLM